MNYLEKLTKMLWASHTMERHPSRWSNATCGFMRAPTFKKPHVTKNEVTLRPTLFSPRQDNFYSIHSEGHLELEIIMTKLLIA